MHGQDSGYIRILVHPNTLVGCHLLRRSSNSGNLLRYSCTYTYVYSICTTHICNPWTSVSSESIQWLEPLIYRMYHWLCVLSVLGAAHLSSPYDAIEWVSVSGQHYKVCMQLVQFGYLIVNKSCRLMKQGNISSSHIRTYTDFAICTVQHRSAPAIGTVCTVWGAACAHHARIS